MILIFWFPKYLNRKVLKGRTKMKKMAQSPVSSFIRVLAVQRESSQKKLETLIFTAQFDILLILVQWHR